MKELSDDEARDFYERMLKVEESYWEHIDGVPSKKQTQEAFDRFYKLEKDFRIHDTSSEDFRKELKFLVTKTDLRAEEDKARFSTLMQGQIANTEQLKKMCTSIEKQSKDTAEMINAWKNLKGAFWTMDKIGKAGMWLLRMMGYVVVGSAAVWAWMKAIGGE